MHDSLVCLVHDSHGCLVYVSHVPLVCSGHVHLVHDSHVRLLHESCKVTLTRLRVTLQLSCTKGTRPSTNSAESTPYFVERVFYGQGILRNCTHCTLLGDHILEKHFALSERSTSGVLHMCLCCMEHAHVCLFKPRSPIPPSVHAQIYKLHVLWSTCKVNMTEKE